MLLLLLLLLIRGYSDDENEDFQRDQKMAKRTLYSLRCSKKIQVSLVGHNNFFSIMTYYLPQMTVACAIQTQPPHSRPLHHDPVLLVAQHEPIFCFCFCFCVFLTLF